MKLTETRIAVDTHTHTVLSGHAFSTINENAAAAAQAGLKAFCATEHGPAMLGGPVRFLPGAYKFIPEELSGVRVITGLEYNIVSLRGDLDLDQPFRKYVGFGIASMHDVCLKAGSKTENTDAYLAALLEPTVDVIGHPGTPYYPCDIEAVVLAAKRMNKMIEINNSSFVSRKGGKVNCAIFAVMCKLHGVRVVVSSDAHHSSMVGYTPEAFKMLDELQFPPELIVNLDYEKFKDYLLERRLRMSLPEPQSRI